MPLLLIVPLLFLLRYLLSFSAANEAQLKGLETSFSLRIRVFLFLVKHTLGWEPVVTDGVRTAAEQAALHVANPKNAAPSASSPHQAKRACDLNFYKGSTWLKKATSRATWEASGIITLAKLCGLRWGGTAFKSYYDPVHFDDL
jgi:hypothetical protein